MIVASAGPTCFVLDAANGTMLFQYQDSSRDSAFDGAATIAHGLLCISNLDGVFSAFAPNT